MRSDKFETITAEKPEWKDTIQALADLLEPGKEYSFNFLVHRLPDVPPAQLSLVLSELDDVGVLQRIVRVESPETGGGIGDFRSLLDVPETIVDYRTGKTLEVTPDNIRTIFVPLAEAA